MMRSLSSAVAGLRTHQTKMDVIGNNIANVNTFGFKAGRTTFADVYYQNLSRGSAPGAMGGINPTQIGYGSNVATIDMLMTTSGASSTDKPMDVYIAGDGLLVCQDANNKTYYTRQGNLGFDEAGNLVDSSGNFVLGFKVDDDGNPIIDADGTVQSINNLDKIQVDPDILAQLTGISISANGDIVGVLPGDVRISLTAPPSWVTDATIPKDSNLTGPVHFFAGGYPSAAAITGLEGVILPNATNSISDFKFGTFPILADADSPGSTEYWVDDDGVMWMEGYYLDDKNQPQPFKAKGTLDEKGKVELKVDGKTVFSFTTDAAKLVSSTKNVTGAYNKTALALDHCYQYSAKDIGGNVYTETTPQLVSSLGTPAKITIGSAVIDLDTSNTSVMYYSGNIAKVNPGEEEAYYVGCLALAKFRNPEGLEQIGSSKFAESPNSGDAKFSRPGVNGTGTLVAGYLEMSNVDISKEFTDMITTQRGFQANTRIVTVSDEMLQELVNLKR